MPPPPPAPDAAHAAPAATVEAQVLDFYRALPFNCHASPQAQAHALRQRNPSGAYPVLAPLLARQPRVLEVGCGTGWFSHALAHHHRLDVTGLDFNPVAIDFARQVARQMRLATHFEAANLFDYRPASGFDLVVSLGVLHHTRDCHGAIRHIGQKLLAPGGHLFLGLYHLHGRRPFLAHFQALRAQGADEAALLARYRKLHPYLADEVHLQSWFRDQVLHPHETQHTLAELLPVLAEAGLHLEATSINRFAPLDRPGLLDEVLALEPGMEAAARQRLAENRYDPGFFLLLARRPA